VHARLWWGNLKGDHLKDPGIDEKIIPKWIFKKCDARGMGWINLAQYRDRWQVVANVVMNLWVP
jgi:hypothetical protein